MKKVVFAILGLSLLSTIGFAQQTNGGKTDEPKSLDEFNYDKISIKERKVVPYPVLRDIDVAFSKLVYRDIDVREKKNLPLKWDRNPLWQILKTNMEAGESGGFGKLKAYANENEHVNKNPLKIADALILGGQKTTLEIPIDPDDPDRTIQKDTFISFDWYKIKKYRIKEEWIFDKQRSEFFVRIIALAPLYEKEIAGMDQPLQLELCWFDYRELRHSLVNQEVFNTKNDAMRLSFLDFFEYRLFSSYIVGENNVLAYGRISDDPAFADNKMSALYESEKIKNDLFTWEHDLWEY